MAALLLSGLLPLVASLPLLLLLWHLPVAAAPNPNLRYFGVWEAEKGCPGGAVEPQQHSRGYFHYPNVHIPTHQNRSACPAGNCAIKTVVAASVAECEAACNVTAKCIAAELANTPAGPMNCTLMYVGGPGVGDSTHDLYVATWAAAPEHAGAPPNLTCQEDQGEWINFVFTSADPLVIKRYHQAGMGPSLLHVRETFFCGNRLCADYKEKWAALLVSTVRPMLKEKSLFGIFFGDEICWSCTSWENVSAAVDAVRADLPRGEAILYYNEAYPVLAFEKCDTGGDFDPNRTNFSYPRVPKGLDWISLDYYPDEGTLKGTPLLFQQHLYPKMAEHQKALFVPPAYGCHGDAACSNRLCCNNSTRDGPNTPCDGDCSVAMLQWAKGSYNWARSDPRIVGLNPWHFTSNGENPPNSDFEPGLEGMPAVLAAYQAIGKEIISGEQRDIDFRRFGLGPETDETTKELLQRSGPTLKSDDDDEPWAGAAHPSKTDDDGGADPLSERPEVYRVVVPQHAAGEGRRTVELTFHPPAIITGALNTSLYHDSGTVHMLNSTAAFVQNFFAIDELHVFGQLLWYGGDFIAANDTVERKYSMYMWSSDGGLSWARPPQTASSPGGTVPPGWFPTIDTTAGGWAFRPGGEKRIVSPASRNNICACSGAQCGAMPSNFTAGCGNCSLSGGCAIMQRNHSAGFLPGSLPAPPWYNFSSAWALDFTADSSGALISSLAERTTLFTGIPRDRGVLAQCGSQFGKTFMVEDWGVGMQNTATLADGTLVTVLCLCQGDRYQNWIYPPLNFSMYSLNAFASTDAGATWLWRGTVANAKDFPESATGPQSETDVVALADGKTLLSVTRMDGDGPCHPPEAPGQFSEGGSYRYYYESYSSDGGVSWTKARPMTRDRAGCVWPRLAVLGSTGHPGGAAALMSGGRICNENITGLFVWANDGMARAPGSPNADVAHAVWDRISVSHVHNTLWRGDSAYLFDEGINASDLFESMTYTSLTPLSNTSVLLTYNRFYHPGNGVDGCWPNYPKLPRPAEYPCGTGFSMRIDLSTSDVPLKVDDEKLGEGSGSLQAQHSATPNQQRGLRWAVAAFNPLIHDFLLHGNPNHWANSSLSVTEATVGIDQCCMPASDALVINRTGHLVTAYPCTINASRFAPYRLANMSVFIDIGAATGTAEESCGAAAGPFPVLGLNCSNPPQPNAHPPQTDCVTPADLCYAALARKEDFGQEVLSFLVSHDLQGISLDWEDSYGNDMRCFRALWMHVKSIIGPHGKELSPWVSNGGAYTPDTGSPPNGNDDYEWNYTAYLPFADHLMNMADYWVTGHGEGGGGYGYNRSMASYECKHHSGRWCGLEGTIVDMLTHGATPQQVVPAVWMARCFPNGTMTLTGWTQDKLREFLDFATGKGVTQLAIWTDGAMSQQPPGRGGNPELTTCLWFVPELLRWVAAVRE